MKRTMSTLLKKRKIIVKWKLLMLLQQQSKNFNRKIIKNIKYLLLKAQGYSSQASKSSSLFKVTRVCTTNKIKSISTIDSLIFVYITFRTNEKVERPKSIDHKQTQLPSLFIAIWTRRKRPPKNSKVRHNVNCQLNKHSKC